MKPITRSIIATVTLLCAAFALSACNTADGVGRDIERGGEEIQDMAN